MLSKRSMAVDKKYSFFFLNGLPCISFVQLVQFKIHVHILGFVDKYVNHISNSLGEEIHKPVASEEETLYI